MGKRVDEKDIWTYCVTSSDKKINKLKKSMKFLDQNDVKCLWLKNSNLPRPSRCSYLVKHPNLINWEDKVQCNFTTYLVCA